MAIINAASAAQADVQAAVNSASDGDTVKVPAGTATWTTYILCSKAITVQGAGIGQTIILDGETDRLAIFAFTDTVLGKIYRLTGFEFRQAPGVSGTNIYGVIQLTGDTKSFRFDRLKFVGVAGHNITIVGSACGVIDHCDFTLISTDQAVRVWHNTWGGAPKFYGDGSWASAATLGTTDAVVIESNAIFNSTAGTATPAACDGFAGARIVFRNNSCHNVHFDFHGTESTGRYRGTRSWEVYNNTFVSDLQYLTPCFLRSGTGVIFGNSATNFQGIAAAVDYQSREPFWYGGASGSNPWDLNTGGVLASGVCGSSTPGVLTVPGATWTPNQWVGKTLRNMSRNWTGVTEPMFGEIIASTATTITWILVHGSVPDMSFSPGDLFEIRQVDATIDQVGRGLGDLISGDTATPVAWPHQASEPVYVWGNTIGGVAATMSSSYQVIRAGRDFFNSAKPGYVPLVFPHPLVTSIDGTPVVPPVVPPPVVPPPSTSASASEIRSRIAWAKALSLKQGDTKTLSVWISRRSGGLSTTPQRAVLKVHLPDGTSIERDMAAGGIPSFWIYKFTAADSTAFAAFLGGASGGLPVSDFVEFACEVIAVWSSTEQETAPTEGVNLLRFYRALARA